MNALHIPYAQVKYLKHAASLIDIKVTAHIREGIVCLHMGDFEFVAFEPALRYLQEESRKIDHVSQFTEALS